MKTLIDVFFIYTSKDTHNNNIMEYVKSKKLKLSKNEMNITNEQLLFLLKSNKESNYLFDDVWYLTEDDFQKINNNESILFQDNQYYNTICIFYKEKPKSNQSKTKKVLFKSKKNKTKKNLEIPIKLLSSS
mgnify:CR=1 FL=1